jgi:hypothetical protein
MPTTLIIILFSIFVSLSFFLFLFFYLCFSIFVSLSLFLYLCFSIFVSLSLFLCLCFQSLFWSFIRAIKDWFCLSDYSQLCMNCVQEKNRKNQFLSLFFNLQRTRQHIFCCLLFVVYYCDIIKHLFATFGSLSKR